MQVTNADDIQIPDSKTSRISHIHTHMRVRAVEKERQRHRETARHIIHYNLKIWKINRRLPVARQSSLMIKVERTWERKAGRGGRDWKCEPCYRIEKMEEAEEEELSPAKRTLVRGNAGWICSCHAARPDTDIKVERLRVLKWIGFLISNLAD